MKPAPAATTRTPATIAITGTPFDGAALGSVTRAGALGATASGTSPPGVGAIGGVLAPASALGALGVNGETLGAGFEAFGANDCTGMGASCAASTPAGLDGTGRPCGGTGSGRAGPIVATIAAGAVGTLAEPLGVGATGRGMLAACATEICAGATDRAVVRGATVCEIEIARGGASETEARGDATAAPPTGRGIMGPSMWPITRSG